MNINFLEVVWNVMREIIRNAYILSKQLTEIIALARFSQKNKGSVFSHICMMQINYKSILCIFKTSFAYRQNLS